MAMATEVQGEPACPGACLPADLGPHAASEAGRVAEQHPWLSVSRAGCELVLHRDEALPVVAAVAEAGEGVGAQARLRSIGKSLGVIVCDVDDDGWPDIIVANDTVRNFFFHNKGDGTFEEIGQISGVAFAEGKARGAMDATSIRLAITKSFAWI